MKKIKKIFTNKQKQQQNTPNGLNAGKDKNNNPLQSNVDDINIAITDTITELIKIMTNSSGNRNPLCQKLKNLKSSLTETMRASNNPLFTLITNILAQKFLIQGYSISLQTLLDSKQIPLEGIPALCLYFSIAKIVLSHSSDLFLQYVNYKVLALFDQSTIKSSVTLASVDNYLTSVPKNYRAELKQTIQKYMTLLYATNNHPQQQQAPDNDNQLTEVTCQSIYRR